MSLVHRSARLCVLLALVATVLAVPASPALAESECVADAAGDVRDIGARAPADVPQADILAACIVHDADMLEIAVRVASPADPETDPKWADLNSAVGAAIDTDGDGQEEFDVNYGRFPDGNLRVSVFTHAPTPQDRSELVCTSDGVFDGTRYRMFIPTSCIGTPDQVSVGAFVFYDSSPLRQEEEGFYDEVPATPGFLGPFSSAPDPDTDVQRLAGGSRVDTAVAVSQNDFANGSAGSVVLARADAFPDALVAAPLAVAADGPLLLTPSFELTPATEAEIRRVLPSGGTVYLSGGTAALTDDVLAEVEALGYDAVRIAGDTRYATSVAIAEAAVAEPDLIVVADGNGFPDALVGGALAGAEAGVEILSNGPELSAEGAAYLAEHPDAEVLAIGAVAAQAVPDATAIVGANPFDTSVQVAVERFGDNDGVGLASGTNFPDGLAGGAHAGRAGIPLVLTWPDLLPDSVESYLEDVRPLGSAAIYGGAIAVSHQIEADLQTALD